MRQAASLQMQSGLVCSLLLSSADTGGPLRPGRMLQAPLVRCQPLLSSHGASWAVAQLHLALHVLRRQSRWL